jgi:antitoxin ParD1/3/4
MIPIDRGEEVFMPWQSLPTNWNSDIGRQIEERSDAMPTRNVNLTDELDRFVAYLVKSGHYENASEVVRAGLRMLERAERQYEAKLSAIRAATNQAEAHSGLGGPAAHFSKGARSTAPPGQ